MTLWRYNPVTGYWKVETKDISPEDRAAYLEAYEKMEPKFTFVFASAKPRNAPPFKECNRITF